MKSDPALVSSANDRSGRFLIPASHKPYALVAEFLTVDAVMEAAEHVRDGEFELWDVHSPMPIHGINRKMGLRPTILPWITLAHGLIGCGLGLLMVWWINATEFQGVPTQLQGYPYLISGKPQFSLPANIPVIFEMTILFAAIGTILGLLGLNKLPMLSSPLTKSLLLRNATIDRFLIVIFADDSKFALGETAEFLLTLGPERLELVTEEP